MATKRRRPVVTEGQAKQAEDVLRYLYNKGEQLKSREVQWEGRKLPGWIATEVANQIKNGASMLTKALKTEGIDCKCKLGAKSQGIRRWNCSCSLAGRRQS